jgi:hypothetical protein
MNLVKAQELVKGMDPAELQKFADGFAPDLIPPWLATGEIQAQMQRAQKMQAMQGAAQGPQPSVKEQIEQKAGLMGLQQAQQRMAQQQQMAQNPMAGPVPEGTPEPEMQPTNEVMMARGGLANVPVSFNYDGGGIVAFNGADGDSEVDADKKKKLRQYTLQEQGAEWEARRQAAREAEAIEDARKTSMAGDAYRGLMDLAKRMALPVKESFENLSAQQKIRQQIEQNRPGFFEALSPEEREARKARDRELRELRNSLNAPSESASANKEFIIPGGQSMATNVLSEAPKPLPAPPRPPAPPRVQQDIRSTTQQVGPVRTQEPLDIGVQGKPNILGLTDPAAQTAVTTALKAPNQADLIAENKARLEAMGIIGRGGEDQEARIKAARNLYEKSRPSGLDDAIRILGQAGQYKGLSGTGPAYTAMQAQKRAEDLKYEQQEMESRNAVDTARRSEGIAGANKVGDVLGKLRDTAASTGASVLGSQMQGNVSLANQASSNAVQMQIAKERNLNAIEVQKIQAASANRPGETERMMEAYGALKAKDPQKAEEYMRNIERIRGAAGSARGVMTRDQAEDNVRKDLENLQVGPKLTKDATDALKASGIPNPTMIQIQEYLVQQKMRSNPASAGASSGKVPPPPAGFKPD